MDILEIFTFSVVGFCVLVMLLLDTISSSERSQDSSTQTQEIVGRESSEERKKDLPVEKSLLGEEDNRAPEEEIVGGEAETRKVAVFECSEAEIREIEAGNPKNNCVSVDGACSSDLMKEDDANDEEFIDDDWEGVERTELEKTFNEALVYVGSKSNDDRLENDIGMQLYGLQKVAIEGPCHKPQPMALMISSRAKWNAWQKLGNMSQELAMEQYINLVSSTIPDWKVEHKLDVQDAGTSVNQPSKL